MRRLLLAGGLVMLLGVGLAGASSSAGSVRARWVIRDLGLGVASGINERGVIVGSSPAKTSLERGLEHAVLWRNGKLQYLGSLRRGSAYSAGSVAINERGQVIGVNTIDDSPSRSQAFLWANGRTILLPGFGTASTMASSINERGQVVGWRGNTAFFHGHAALWQGGKVTDLGSLRQLSNSWAVAINNRGQIVGNSQDDRRETGDPTGKERACLWQNGRLIDLGSLPGRRNSWAVAVNDRGQIVGNSNASTKTVSTQPSHAFVRQSGRMRDLGTLGGEWSTAAAINERGQVIGESALANGTRHGFLWQNGQMTDLGALIGDTTSTATAINDRGLVIGTSYTRADDFGPHAFVWRDGTMSALPTLGGSATRAVAINNHNQIVGVSSSRATGAGEQHAVLWTLVTD